MKVIRLNENDIEKLVKKIIKEEGENFDWIGDIGQYDLFGYYVGKPVEKLTGVSNGNVLEVTAIVGDEIEYFVSYNGMSEIIKGYPYSSEGPYYMSVKDLLDELQNGNVSKFQLPIDESRLFGEPKKTADERIAEYILQKLEKERADIQHQFLDYTKNFNNFYGVKSNVPLEGDLFRVDFNNKSKKINTDNSGHLRGGDFGVVKVYEPWNRKISEKKLSIRGYGIALTGQEPLKIKESLVRQIYDKVEEQYGDIRVFKSQRKLDKGTDDESDIFDQLTQ